MPEGPGSGDFDEVVGLLATAFPGIRCLRCNSENFYLLDSPPIALPRGPLTDEKRPIMRLACTRCGFVEEHVTGVLRNTLEKQDRKPIVEPAK